MGKSKILIIDDEPNNVTLLHDLLELKGFSVITANNGPDGLSRTKTDQPEMVLLDINLPEMDGWEVLRQLKSSAETRDIPVLIISAIAQEIDAQRARTDGACGYMAKPLDIKQLMARLEKLSTDRR